MRLLREGVNQSNAGSVFAHASTAGITGEAQQIGTGKSPRVYLFSDCCSCQTVDRRCMLWRKWLTETLGDSTFL